MVNFTKQNVESKQQYQRALERLWTKLAFLAYVIRNHSLSYLKCSNSRMKTA